MPKKQPPVQPTTRQELNKEYARQIAYLFSKDKSKPRRK